MFTSHLLLLLRATTVAPATRIRSERPHVHIERADMSSNIPELSTESDLWNLLVKGEQLPPERMIETGLDVAYLEQMFEIVKPHVAHMEGLRPLGNQWVAGQELSSTWNSAIAGSSVYSSVLCVRLSRSGVSLFRKSGGIHSNNALLVFLDALGECWITCVSDLSTAHRPPNRFERHGSIMAMNQWITAFIDENDYQPYGDTGWPIAMQIGHDLDRLLERDIAVGERRLAERKKAYAEMTALSLRVIGRTRPS